MGSPTCVIRYHEQDQTLTIRVEGRATMTYGLPVRRLGERAIQNRANQILFDLRDCSHVDSTFLGTMLTLKKLLDRCNGRLAIVAPSTSCSRILEQMGLSDYLPTQPDEKAVDGQWTELAVVPEDVNTFRRNVVQAHEELAALPGSSGEQFKSLVRYMEETDKPPPPK